jgi:hypothetical protein
MKITRRALAGFALAGAASAQSASQQPQPPSGADDLDRAKKQVEINSKALRDFDLSMSAEPAFQFKA